MKTGKMVILMVVLVAMSSSHVLASSYVQTNKLTADDAATEDRFGYSVDISGDNAIVGAVWDDSKSGSAYIFNVYTGEQGPKLTATDAQASDKFGYSVGISGDIAVVGAPDKNTSTGAAYLFNVTTGNQLFKLTASDGNANDEFGHNVAICGNIVIIGARTDSDLASRAGSAYLFDATTGNQLSKITASDAAIDDYFGSNVDCCGNIAIVASPLDDDNGTDSGSVYVFDISDPINPVRFPYTKLIPIDGAAGDIFGNAIAIYGDVAIVGAPLNDDDGADSGSAYLFDINTGNQLFKLTAPDAAAGDYFGNGVAISGNVAIVAAPLDDDDGADSGSAYLFDVTTGNFLEKITACDADAEDNFGLPAICDNNIIIGAQGNDDAGAFSGSAYLFSELVEIISWVYINDPGVPGHEGFIGYISKYEVTNDQYCAFLNAALATEDIVVDVPGNLVKGHIGSNEGADFEGEVYYNLAGTGYTANGATNGGAARINYSGSMFTVDCGFENHPVTHASWYGATAFCNYYGYRLPTEWEWQAVADYYGSFIYGCGTTIDPNKANYSASYHPDGTTIVGSFGEYGYGMCDMAGNVWELTSTLSPPNCVQCGGSWYNDPDGSHCTVTSRSYTLLSTTYNHIGFRVVLLRTLHVDTINGDDSNDGLSRESAFATIQKGIEVSQSGDTVLVWPGVYEEPVDFSGKAITVQSAADAAVITQPGNTAVKFIHDEGPGCILSNFVVCDSDTGIYCDAASPTIKHVTVVNNQTGIQAENGANPDIKNSILWGNALGDLINATASDSWVMDEKYQGMVGYWRFDEGGGSSAKDSSSNGNDGTIAGASWTTGQIDGALSFDGDDDYVEVTDDGSLSGMSQLTVGCWFKSEYWYEGSNLSVIVSKAYQGDGLYTTDCYQISNFIYAGKYTFACGIYGSNSECSFHAVIDDVVPDFDPEAWHHAALTYDSSAGQVKVYLDGQPIHTESCSIGTLHNNTTAKLRIGNFDGTSPNYRPFNGNIDEVVIYTRKLSSEEIQDLYKTGDDGKVMDDPLFANPAGSDYHLKSERGRYRLNPCDPNAPGDWVLDEVTSPCIDAGNPADDASAERTPNGERVNQGAYGATAYASLSMQAEIRGTWPLRMDCNLDGIVNLLDFACLADEWLEEIEE